LPEDGALPEPLTQFVGNDKLKVLAFARLIPSHGYGVLPLLYGITWVRNNS